MLLISILRCNFYQILCAAVCKNIQTNVNLLYNRFSKECMKKVSTVAASTAEVNSSVSLWSQFTTAASRRTVPSLMISVSQSAFAYLSHLNDSDQTHFNIRQKYPEFSFICHTQAWPSYCQTCCIKKSLKRNLSV